MDYKKIYKCLVSSNITNSFVGFMLPGSLCKLPDVFFLNDDSEEVSS